jgi:predicted aldo/keto reductase-like oxidoreductase
MPHRQDPDQWIPNGRPAYLIAQAKGSLRKLGVEQIDLWQLHRIDPRVPRDEQFGAVRRLLDDGIVRHAGLSEVSVADIEAARRVFPVATVQNRYNLVDRGSEQTRLSTAWAHDSDVFWKIARGIDPLHVGEASSRSTCSAASMGHSTSRAPSVILRLLFRAPLPKRAGPCPPESHEEGRWLLDATTFSGVSTVGRV